jgi:hypothetical protein
MNGHRYPERGCRSLTQQDHDRVRRPVRPARPAKLERETLASVSSAVKATMWQAGMPKLFEANHSRLQQTLRLHGPIPNAGPLTMIVEMPETCR